ncbi:alkaline phosphatase [Fictibacillus enclensis]|uniref:alkaline phosphatase n=1 Tax=Fictibacillus enclensis TaxID=1017270 RepID=UPI0025A008BE|nr:alkaline phosphatase [Fictibacillus enclensis]MDM5337078.1 alkaline phosphatase [Fictibacillus enclensis]
MKKDRFKKWLPIALSTAVGLGAVSMSMHGDAKNLTKKEPKIKNVIFMIGDGMGPSATTALRYWKDDPDTMKMEKTAFDRYFVGKQMTYADDPDENITDSASAATAMSTGEKTYNAAIAVDKDQKELKTVLEAAKARGKSTGLVATSELAHATPASFGAHDPNRKNMNEIANDYFDEKISHKHKVDVLLGGGSSNFIRNDRNLVNEFKNAGYSYVTTKDQLLRNKNELVLGLFAKGGMLKMIDRNHDLPSLKDMTTSAIKQLDKDKDGFFLMVEGSQIDWGEHDNDIVSTMSEMQDFEKAFQAAVQFAKKDKHTLVVATADHATGGISVGANGKYNWFTEPIKAFKRTPDFLSETIASGADVEATLGKYVDLSLTPEEINSVKEAAKSKDVTKIDATIEKIADLRSNTGWTTTGHTGEDVNVYAYGPGKEKFAGLINNTDQAKKVFKIVHTGK